MSFYVGCYLVSADVIDPKHDRDSWAFPADSDQHMSDTSNVEDLYINVTDMDVLPSQIQIGADQYTDDEGFAPDHAAFDQFYVRDEKFYVRGFVKGTALYNEFYTSIGAGFYTRSFTVGTALYNEFYMRQEPFYLSSFTAGTELYNTFYVSDQEFYLRSFTPVDFFYILGGDC